MEKEQRPRISTRSFCASESAILSKNRATILSAYDLDKYFTTRASPHLERIRTHVLMYVTSQLGNVQAMKPHGKKLLAGLQPLCSVLKRLPRAPRKGAGASRMIQSSKTSLETRVPKILRSSIATHPACESATGTTLCAPLFSITERASSTRSLVPKSPVPPNAHVRANRVKDAPPCGTLFGG